MIEPTPARPPWPILGILVAAAILSFVDRQILGLMIDPIRRDLGVGDFAMGLLGGPAFAVFYALAGLPIGVIVDRVDRGRLIALGVAGWSLMTALSGFAGSYWQLFVARVGVGVGEATLGPAAHSLIGDRFSRDHLPLAMSLYSTGVALGAGLAFALGGWVVALASGPARAVVGLGTLAPWQATFVIVGLPGLLVALIILLRIRDPRAPRPVTAREHPFAGVGGFWRAHRRLIVLHLTGVSALTSAGFANLLWLPSVFVRGFAWTPLEIGTALGIMLIVLGVGGTVACGALASRLVRGGQAEAPMLVAAATAAAAVPFAAATLMPSATLTLAMLVPAMAIGSAYVGLGPAIVQSVAPPALRGRIAAISLMLTSLAGMVVGPVGVGALTDFVFADPAQVGLSLAIVVAALSVLGAACLFAAIPSYRDALARPR